MSGLIRRCAIQFQLLEAEAGCCDVMCLLCCAWHCWLDHNRLHCCIAGQVAALAVAWLRRLGLFRWLHPRLVRVRDTLRRFAENVVVPSVQFAHRHGIFEFCFHLGVASGQVYATVANIAPPVPSAQNWSLDNNRSSSSSSSSRSGASAVAAVGQGAGYVRTFVACSL